jgi:hypothetical protein
MIKYTIIVMVLFYIIRGAEINKQLESRDENAMFYFAIQILWAILMTPIFGRILGWW